MMEEEKIRAAQCSFQSSFFKLLLTNPDVSRISVGDLFVQRTAVAKDDKEDRQAGRREGLRYYSLNISIQPAVYLFVLSALVAY